MPALPESLAVLREGDYRLLFSAQTVSLFGDGMVNVALAFAVLGLGGSASAVGLVFACRSLALVLSLIVGGVVADRVPRRSVMLTADLLRFASQGTMAALLIGGGAHLWTLGLLAAVSGGATGFFNPASTGLLPALVESDRLQQANGLRATAMAAGEILGPIVAGVLVATAGAGWAIAIDAATFAASAAFLLRLRLPPAVARAASSFLADLRGGWGEFRARTWVWAVVAASAVANMLWGAWSTLGPVVAHRSLGGATAWGLVLAAMGAGGLAGGVLSIRARPQRPLVVFAVGGLVYAIPLALLAAGAAVPLLALAALFAGVANMIGNTVWESTLQRGIPAGSLSRVSSYDWFGSLAFYPIGLMIWGPVSAGLGIHPTLWLAFALYLVSTVALLATPDIRRMRTPAAADPVR